MPNPHSDVHRVVTDQVIAMLGRGGDVQIPWHRPGAALMRPTNVASNKAYRGINILCLWATAEEKGFFSGVWGTYRQWREVGAQVRKGEKAAFVIIFKKTSVSSDDENEPSRRLFARASPVFAAEQVEGWHLHHSIQHPRGSATPIEEAEAFVAASGASVCHGGHRAFYSPSTDAVQMPAQTSFIGTPTSTATEAYYAVLLHELVHWTSAEHRCNRQLGKRFGDAAYAMEELVAELGSAFLCADIGVTLQPRPDHAHYVDHWLAIMKADKRAVFAAASAASKAADFLSSMQTK